MKATCRRGFALPMAIVLVAIVSITLLAILGYTSFSTRMTAEYTAKTRCRLAAESILEMMRYELYTRFQRHVGENSTGSSRVLISPQNAAAFRWFTDATTRQAIGTGSTRFEIPDFFDWGGCRVRGRIAHVERTSSGTGVTVTLMATAELTLRGRTHSATLAERVKYGIDRSTVFDNAYFVNNYGWFSGSGLVANGDVRANGNMSLDTSTKINGRVFAAYNAELGVLGTIKNYGAMDRYDTYRTTTYGTSGRSRPLSPVSGGYEAPKSSVTSTDCRNRLYPEQETSVNMPWISNLDDYIAYGKQNGASLKQGSTTIISSNKGYYDGVGPSGDHYLQDGKGGYVLDANGQKVRAADDGVLVLTGTQSNPIRLDGPVVVSNDVIISGYVTGQGTIYSARNIHIVGSIKYANPPVWSDRTKAADNSTKDLLGLAAQGNIVLGDCTSSSWLSSIKSTISTQPYVQPYICDEGDAAIGYPRTELGETKFCGDYTQTDGGSKIVENRVVVGTHTETTYRWGRPYTQTVTDYATVLENSKTRHYYDSVVKPSEISSRCSTITQIDAVLYNNHGIFGKIGDCTLNGALVCRNEGIMYSSRFYLNWDYRLYSHSAEHVENESVGLPVGEASPRPISFQEVPDEWNKDSADD